MVSGHKWVNRISKPAYHYVVEDVINNLRSGVTQFWIVDTLKQFKLHP